MDISTVSEQILTLVIIINVILGLIILIRNKKKIENILFSATLSSVALWSLSLILFNKADQRYIDIYANAAYVFSAIVIYSFFLFAIVFQKSLVNKKHFLLISSMLFLFYVLPNVIPGAIFAEIVIDGHDITTSPNWGLHLHTLQTFVVFVLAILCLLYKVYKSSGMARIQLSVISVGAIISTILAVVTNVIVFSYTTKYNWLGPVATLFLVVSTFYAIVKHRLMNISMAVVRSLSFSVMILVLVALLATSTGMISLFTKDGLFTPLQTAIVAFVIALVFWPLRIWVTKATDRFFYKMTYDPEALIDSVVHQISSTLVAKDILGGANKILSKRMKLSRCAFVLFNDNKETLRQETYNWPEFKLDNLYDLASDGLLVGDELEDGDNRKLLFIENNTALLVPIKSGDRVIGVFLSGEKNSGNLFDQQDIRTLNIIAQSMALALENAKSYSQIKDFNETLRQRIDEATKELRVKNAILKKLDKTKDEFIGVASHQLRTPLTSINGYISMLMDGDAGKLNDQQKKILNNAHTSSEKMVRLVNDFLDVSRLQTGKFVIDRKEVNLKELVRTEVEGLSAITEEKEITVSCACHDEVPILELDENKIRQVVMNFIDNAIFYSHLKSEIKIGLSFNGQEVSFTVQDSGIGVPKSEQKELFAKFYRASNAKQQRPSGSGLGLYLAKKVIDAHGGQIIFKTVEGKGSTFGFTLPVK